MNKNRHLQSLLHYLTYAGSLPFVGCAVLLAINKSYIPILGDTRLLLSTYSLLICAFMAGSHWGIHLKLKHPWSFYLPLSSNISALLAGALYLLAPFSVFMYSIALNFFVLLGIDYCLYRQTIINRYYFTTRMYVTGIVVIALLFAGSVAQ